MKATQVLMQEHRCIERMLNVLEAIALRFQQNEEVDYTDLEHLLDFFTVFADQCHHHKEEDHLFPTLEQAGIPRQGGPIGVMLYEHHEGRNLRQEMSNLLPRLATEEQARKDFAESALAFVQLLRDHIWKEDNILFQMADNLLREEENQNLLKYFNRVEQEELGAGVHEKYHHLVEELEAKLRVTS